MIIVLILNLPIIYNMIVEPKIIAIKYNADENKKTFIYSPHAGSVEIHIEYFGSKYLAP